MSLHLALGRVVAGARRGVARHRLIRWLPVTVCCCGLVVTVDAAMARVDAARHAWSETRSVWVATRDHAPGEPVVAERLELPMVAIPDDAAEDLAAAASARQHLGRGEIVTAADVTGAGPLALVPPGWRALAVREPVASGAQVGERVDVVSDGVVIADGALVVDRIDDAVLIAVTVDAAALVAHAGEQGVALLRTP
jgi:hypothetical protein